MTTEIELGIDTMSIEGEATKLFEALAKAQGEFVAVAKTATGQIGKDRKFKYADYNTLTRCVRPALTANGIVLIQPLHSRGDHAVTTTVIAGHGAVIKSSLSFKQPADPQEFGRHHTYYRRYQLQAMLGLAGDDDADEPPLTGAQYSEPAREEASPGKAVASAGKKSVAVEKKPAAVEPKQEIVATSNGSLAKPLPVQPPLVSEPKPGDTRTINQKLVDGMKQKGWKMADVKQLFIEHIDPAGFESPDNLTIELKQKLWDTMINKAGVAPF
jgi:hypothetical protein